jgi:hypothetical protein
MDHKIPTFLVQWFHTISNFGLKNTKWVSLESSRRVESENGLVFVLGSIPRAGGGPKKDFGTAQPAVGSSIGIFVNFFHHSIRIAVLQNVVAR